MGLKGLGRDHIEMKMADVRCDGHDGEVENRCIDSLLKRVGAPQPPRILLGKWPGLSTSTQSYDML
jgi:hypothetical protein